MDNKKVKLGLGLEEYSKFETFPEDTNPRQKIADLAKLMYQRNLSDAGGGNLSCRVGNKIYLTPRYLGELKRFNVNMDEIITMNLDSTVVDGNPDMITREGDIHLRLYNEFPSIRAILHSHARNIVPFASTGTKIPANTEMFKHLLGENEIEISEDVGPATDKLAISLTEKFSKRQAELNKYGAAVMIPNHGLIVAGRNLDYAFAILETIDTSAYVYINKLLLSKLQ